MPTRQEIFESIIVIITSKARNIGTEGVVEISMCEIINRRDHPLLFRCYLVQTPLGFRLLDFERCRVAVVANPE